MKNFTYFKDSEIVGLDTELIAKLDQARHRSDIPFVITDGLRTADTNTDLNSVKNSAHLTGNAVDLRCHDFHSLWRMLDGLFFAGFKRIGVYIENADGKFFPTHVHVDNDLSKPQEVVWLTVEK